MAPRTSRRSLRILASSRISGKRKACSKIYGSTSTPWPQPPSPKPSCLIIFCSWCSTCATNRTKTWRPPFLSFLLITSLKVWASTSRKKSCTLSHCVTGIAPIALRETSELTRWQPLSWSTVTCPKLKVPGQFTSSSILWRLLTKVGSPTRCLTSARWASLKLTQSSWKILKWPRTSVYRGSRLETRENIRKSRSST